MTENQELVRDTPKTENECKHPGCHEGMILKRGLEQPDGGWKDGWRHEKCPLCLGTGTR